MHRIMLEKSPQLDRASLVKYAREIGLDVGKFTESLDRKKHADSIRKDVDLAVSLDIYSTPTYFLNGRKIVGNREYDFLRKAVDEELAARR